MIAVISLEAPAQSLLEPLIENKMMPNLAALQAGGEVIDLDPPFLDGSVYATLYTGQHLSEHGIYSLFNWSASQQRLRLSYDLMSRDTLFTRLDRAGKRVLAIDPAEHPPQELKNGIMVSGCQFNSRVHLPKWTRPARLDRELFKVLGKSPRGEEAFGRPSESLLLHLSQVFIKAPNRLAQAVEYLVNQYPPDVLWVSMAMIHVAGHQLWDPASVDALGRTQAGEKVLEHSLKNIYMAADAALGRILKILPDNADLLLYWGKGMGHETSRSDLLPGMLDRILNPDVSNKMSAEVDTLTKLRAIMPTSFRAKVADAIPDEWSLRLTALLATIGKNWKDQQAFCLPSDGPGLIRLNLRGRERKGVVAAFDAQAVYEQIACGLRTFSDIHGGPCIAEIERPLDFLPPGQKMEDLPDLVIRWNKEKATRLTGVTSPVFGNVNRQGWGSGRSGNHKPGAKVILKARSGTYQPIKWRRPRLVDLSATVCAAIGVPYEDLPGQSFLV